MTTLDRQAVLDCLSRLVTPGIKLTALADELGVRKHEYTELRSILFDLVEEGTVHVLTGGAFALAPSGRASDPRGKAVPALEPKQPAAPKKIAAKKPGRAALPWTKPTPPTKTSHRAPPPVAKPQSGPREEYDPETGEIRIRTGNTMPPPTGRPRTPSIPPLVAAAPAQ